MLMCNKLLLVLYLAGSLLLQQLGIVASAACTSTSASALHRAVLMLSEHLTR